MRKESFLLTVVLCVVGLIVLVCSTPQEKVYEPPQPTGVDAVELVTVRDLLYEYAMDICTGLAECDGSCFYTDVDSVSVEIFKTYRVPSLETLLGILDQIDDNGSVYDVYDDDEGTVFEYYTLRERYESFF